jgi:hypothetical protein
VGAGGAIIVNANPRGPRKWLLKVYDQSRPSIDEMPDVYLKSGYARKLVSLLADAVRRLPLLVRLPRCERLYIPSFYLIVYAARNNGDGTEPVEVAILDVVGVKPDGAPSSWSYRLAAAGRAYWHPRCQSAVAAALERALRAGG